jgi:hypothetical protein
LSSFQKESHAEKFEKPGSGVVTFVHVIPSSGSVASAELAQAIPGKVLEVQIHPSDGPRRRPKVIWGNRGA